MKKLITLFMLLVTIVTGAKADDASWKNNTMSPANYFELGANTVVASNSKTIESVSYTHSINMTSKSNQSSNKTNGYYIKFTVSSKSNFSILFGANGGGRTIRVNTGWSYDVSTNATQIANGATPTGGVMATSANVSNNQFGTLSGEDLEPGTYYICGSGSVSIYNISITSAVTKTVVSQDYAGVKKGDATLVENTDFTKDGNTITLGDAYKTLTAPTDFKLINHITYSDESTDNADVDVAFGATATEGYFVGTATIALTTYTVKVPEEIPASAPTITTDLAEEYNVLKGNSIELSIVAEGATSYQWWTAVGPIEGATSSSYTVEAGTDPGDFQIYYCAATNAAGTTYSSHAKVTTVGRADCELTNIQFSNGAYGAINSATYGDGTVAFPYSANGSVPTVVPTSIVVSAGATYALDGNLLTVTAEDGTTKKQFTINAVEMTPLEVDEDVETTTFTAVPSWAFNLYGYDSGKGVKFAKKVDQAGNMRIALGNTRLYMFISKAKSITLTSGTAGARAIKVYRNGAQLSTPTATAAENNTITIELDETAPNMILIESNQTDGDTGFTKYAIEAAAPTENVTIDESGVATYVTTNALDFSTQNGAFKAYVITGLNAAKTSAQAAEVTQVPAGTALLLKGAEGSYGVEIIESAEAVDNMLLASDGSVTGADDIFAYSKTDKKFKKVATTVTIPAGKAYLQIANAGDALDIDFDGETAVEAIAEANEADAAAPVKVIKNGQLFIGNFNVAGQQVK